LGNGTDALGCSVGTARRRDVDGDGDGDGDALQMNA
jgi:hypothetical protein